jgi:mRNA interferase MazF
VKASIEHGWLYLADLNPRRGTDPGKTRPVLVIQSDLLNRTGHPSTWILPCTTRLTGESVLRTVVPRAVAGNTAACELMIDQSRSIDNRRFTKRLKRLPLLLLREVKAKLRQAADL